MKIALLLVFAVGCSSAGIGLDGDDANDPPCGAKARLVGGACVAADALTVRAHRSGRQTGNGFSFVSVCFSTPADVPLSTPPPPVASDGPCLVRVSGPSGAIPGPSGPPPPDAGRILVRGAEPELLTFVATERGPCYSNGLPLGVISLSGEKLLETSGEGGADYPAFSARVFIPTDVVIETDELGPSRASFRWRAGDGRRPVQLTARADDGQTFAVLECEVPDSGSYTAPAPLMQHFPAAARNATMAITRSRSAHLEPPGTERVIDVTMVNETAKPLRWAP